MGAKQWISMACGWALAWTASAQPSDRVLATYAGGEVTAAEVASWRAFQRLAADAPIPERQVRAVALLEIYARLAGDPGPLATARGRRLDSAHARRLAARALETSLIAEARPTEEALLRRWNEERGAFDRPARWKLENLFLARRPGRDPVATRAQLEAWRAELVAGADFGELAARHSESETAARRGAMGWASADRLLPEVAEAVVELVPGELTPVLETERGWTLIRVVDFAPPRPAEFKEARPRLEARLTRERLEALRHELDAALRARLEPITLHRGQDGGAVVTYRDGPSRRELGLEDLEIFLELSGGALTPEVASGADPAPWRELVMETARAAEADRRGLTTTPEHLNDQFWQRLHLAAALWGETQVEVTAEAADEAALRDWYEEHGETLDRPAADRFALLEIALRQDTPRDLVERAEAMSAELRSAGRSLEEAAGDLDPEGLWTRVRPLGWLDERDLFHLGFRLQPLADELAVGGRTPLVQQGPYLLMLEKQAHREARSPTFEEARAQVEAAVRAERRRAALRALEDRVLSGHAFVMVETDEPS